MSRKKKVHDLLSPKIASKRSAKKEAAQKEYDKRLVAIRNGEEDPGVPAKVNNYVVNKPLFGPHKIKRKKNVPVKRRKISPNEGKPAVNAKTNVEKLIHKPLPKAVSVDPTAGAIEVRPKSKKGSKKNVSKETKQSSKETPSVPSDTA